MKEAIFISSTPTEQGVHFEDPSGSTVRTMPCVVERTPIHFDADEFDRDCFFRIRWGKSAYHLGRRSHETSYRRCVALACRVCRSSNRKEARERRQNGATCFRFQGAHAKNHGRLVDS